MNAVVETIMDATRVVPLIEAVELNPRPDRASLSDELEVSFVPMAAVEAGSGRMDGTAIRRFGEVKKGYTAFREGDVLFAKITPCMENGKMAVASGLRNGVGCGSTEFHVLRPRPGVDPHYVYYFVSSGRFRAEAAHHMTGAVGQKRVPAAFLEQCEIPLPDLAAQRRIVAELEKQFYRLDEAVANLKRARRNITAMRRAVLDAAALGRLPIQSARDELAGNDISSQVMAARRKKWAGASKYKEPVAPDPELPLNVPRHWATLSWEAILLPEDGAFKRGPFGSSLTKAMFVDQGYKVYEQYCPINDDCSFARYYIDATKFDEMKDFAVRAGDFLISCSGVTLGRITRVPLKFEPGIINQALLRVRVDPEVVEPAFFQIVFRSPTFQGFLFERSAGAAIPNLRGVGQLKAIPVPVPPLSEQRKIVAEVERRVSIVREVEAEVDVNLKRATVLRGSVLARAFS